MSAFRRALRCSAAAFAVAGSVTIASPAAGEPGFDGPRHYDGFYRFGGVRAPAPAFGGPSYRIHPSPYFRSAYDPYDDRFGPYRHFPEPGTYLVQPGDTLDDIAFFLGVSTYALLQANPQIRNEDFIRIGERLRLPRGVHAYDGYERFPPGYGPSGPYGPYGRVSYRGHAGPRGDLLVVPYVEGRRTGIVVSSDRFPPNANVKIAAGPSLDDAVVFSSAQAGPDGVLKVDLDLPDRFRRRDTILVATTVDDKFRVLSGPIEFVEPGEPFGGRFYGADGPHYPVARREFPFYFGDAHDADDYAGYVRVGDEVTVEGVVTPEGERCPAVRNATGRLFTIATSTEQARPGDRIKIKGRVAPPDWCGQGISIAASSVRFGADFANAPPPRRAYDHDRDDKDHFDRDDRIYDRDDKLPPLTPPLDKRGPDFVPPLRGSSYDGRLGFGGDFGPTEVVRGNLTDESGDDCATVRDFAGTLYSVPARLTGVRIGDRIELIGRRTHQRECSRGIVFEVEEARRL